jgi:hypothetical protein
MWMRGTQTEYIKKFLTLVGILTTLTNGGVSLAGSSTQSNSTASPAEPAYPTYYDEIYDQNQQVRPTYQDILPIYQQLGSKKQEQFLKSAKKDFHGDNALDPLPRILSESEYNQLRRGTEQRGNALLLFLQAYYSGDWPRIEKVIPKETLQRIIERAHETAYLGHVKPESVAFPYGPDIIRDAQGKWRVVEDNPGYIGGVGDLKIAREILLKRIPQYKEKLKPIDRPESYYDDLVARYKGLRNPPTGKMVIYMVPPYPDNEDIRLKKIFGDRGVEVITPFTKKKLVSNARGVFIESKSTEGTLLRQRVGFVVLDSEHAVVDSNNPLARRRALIEEAQATLTESRLRISARQAITAALKPDPKTGQIDLEKLDASFARSNFLRWSKSYKLISKGLIDSMLSGKVASNYSPGVDFIGDKEFYIYVPDIVREFMHEKPILENIPTLKTM